MNNIIEIIPKEGLSDIKFGAGMDEVIKILGEPDETEAFNDEDFETNICTYWERGLNLFFEGEGKLVLTYIEIDNENTLLYGQKIIGVQESMIVSLMSENGYNDWEAEEEEWGEKRLSYISCAIDFFFENNSLVSVCLEPAEGKN
ncbi:MAG: hypothetical protein BWY70_01352 [Bacteroidetes bacterium ADurb.Bin408]|nr:MAG: hypothetical protein BWY70_01352 [Bacteroidetes bacterium ADurb.Bin408]